MTMKNEPEKKELLERIASLHKSLLNAGKEWDAAFVFGKVNGFYLTNTYQEGVFILKKDGSYGYFVIRSFERARMESPLDNIYAMRSFKDIVPFVGDLKSNIYMDTDVVTLSHMARFNKYIPHGDILPLEATMSWIRAVKSPYEVECVQTAGRLHKRFLEEIVPGLLYEGINEAQLAADIFSALVKSGHQGSVRFAMFQTDLIVGQVAIGDNCLYPNSFNGPSGMKGLSPAVPVLGDRNRVLKKGDLVFVDVPFGVNGYQTDRTQVYMFGEEPSQEVVEKHRYCVSVQKKIAASLKPGNIPSEIYEEIKENGFENRQVKFLGHGVGLFIDEYPVIAKGFDKPLVENMVIAIEPKIGIEGFGIVGGEDTYLVTKDGGKLITGGEGDIIRV